MKQISNYLPKVRSEYFINPFGIVYSMLRNHPEVIVGKLDKDGYNEIGLYMLDGTRKYFRKHRLMGVVYLSLDLESDFEINHKNGDKDDNVLDNLEVVTSSENAIHSFHVLGNDTYGNLPKNARRTKVYNKDTKEIKYYDSIRDMVADYSDWSYDYICNKLAKKDGNCFYKGNYNITVCDN